MLSDNAKGVGTKSSGVQNPGGTKALGWPWFEGGYMDGASIDCCPCCCSKNSLSWATILASSSNTRANGRATRSAEVVNIHTRFPTRFPPALRKEADFWTRWEMACLVVGGTMSTSAAMRSSKVSSVSMSEETEEREEVEDALEEASEP